MVTHVNFLDACGKDDLGKIEKFLDLGNDLDATSDSGNTGLRNACVADHPHIVQFLLENGANPNQKLWLKSRVNDVFLCEQGFAIFYARSEKVVDILKAYGADLSVYDKYGVSVREWWQKLGRDDEFIAAYF